MNSAQFIDQPHCYLCGSSQRAVERELGTEEGQLYLRWVRCRECELVYLDPRPSLHALTVLYDSQGYWQGESGYQDYIAEESWRRRQARDRAEWFASKLNSELAEPVHKVLEVGSAAGYFLEELATRGILARGLDLSRPMVRLSGGKTVKGVSVSHGPVEETQFPRASFHGLAAWGCDSNFNDPSITFRRFGEWLKPGGLLVFNFHEYDHWANFLKGRFKLMPNALYFLSRKQVRRLLETFGFELVSMCPEVSWMNLASVFHHTGHRWLKPAASGPLAHHSFKLPVPGAFRVLARRLPGRSAG